MCGIGCQKVSKVLPAVDYAGSLTISRSLCPDIGHGEQPSRIPRVQSRSAIPGSITPFGHGFGVSHILGLLRASKELAF
jgi:hypothetical protein